MFNKDSLVFWTKNSISPIDSLMYDEMILTKLSSHYYLQAEKKTDVYKLFILSPVYSKYKFENEYLKNKFENNYTHKNNIELSTEKGEYNISNSNGDFLFSLNFKKADFQNTAYNSIITGLYLLFLLFFILAFSGFLKSVLKSQELGFLIFSFVLIALKIFSKIFSFPNLLYQSPLFKAESFAINNLISSLGDFLFIAAIILGIVIYSISIIDKHKIKIKGKQNNIKILLLTFIFLASFVVIDLLFYSVKTLILNSGVNFDLSNPNNINYLSITAYLIIALNSISAILLINTLLKNLRQYTSNNKLFYLVLTVSFLFHLIIFSLIIKDINYFYNVFLIFLFLLIIYSSSKENKRQTNEIILQFLILSFGLNFFINVHNNYVEKEERLAAAIELSINQDPEAEYVFSQTENRIYADKRIPFLLRENEITFDSITTYVKSHHFDKNKFWNKYDVQITICDQYQELLIKPENYTIACNDFFNRNLLAFGKLTQNNNLYYLEYGSGQTNYLGILQFEIEINDFPVIYTFYIEINSKIKREGYSKLLTESGYDPFEKIQNYSLARYIDSLKVEEYGDFEYPEIFSYKIPEDNEHKFTEIENYNHLIFKSNNSQIYVLSKQKVNTVDKFATFSYLFTLLTVMFLLLSFLFNKQISVRKISLSFSFRLQFSVIVILLFAFAIIGAISSYYIRGLNYDKNESRTNELSNSLKTEFEHKISKPDSPGISSKDYISEIAVKFSKVFNTDINVYDTNGRLISSTRPKLFELKLLSENINPLAFASLKNENKSYFINNESIGNLKFMSAYRPINNENDKVIAYINLPYFAKQDEQRKEMTSFLLALLNVYTLIIILSIFIAIVISNYTTRPLLALGSKMKAVKLSNENEKIEWKRDDEIGNLIKEYNKMIEELNHSAELLAQSERASAWKEMARQVAHEIKNPLTPMRLNIQHLQNLKGSPEFEDKFTTMSNSLIEQIDSLSEIASAFSDFAKMPKFKDQKVNLKDIIHSSAEINQSDEADIIFLFNQENDYWVQSDKQQLLRAFNNLISNALQASKADEKLILKINIKESEKEYRIIFSDNGIGIPEEKKSKIFVPNFTTKSSGMGLGLAIVKNIINSSKGSIDFKSKENEGTEFIIKIPKANN